MSGVSIKVNFQKLTRGRVPFCVMVGDEAKHSGKVDPFDTKSIDAAVEELKAAIPGLNGEAEQFRAAILQQAKGRKKKAKATPAAGSDVTSPTEKPSVLTPGAHSTDAGDYIEIGNHAFTDSIIGAIPPKMIYRRATVPGEIVGNRGEMYFAALSNEAVRIIADRHVRLTKWVTRGKGENAQQVLIYDTTTRDNAALILSSASTDTRLPDVKVLSNHPIYTAGYTLARPGFHDGTFYDEPESLVGLEPELDPEVIRGVLDDVVTDFPLKDQASIENYFGLLLTAITRPAIAGNVPLFLILATLERTGKTKLAEEVLGGIILGRRTPAQQMANDDTEMDKRLTSILMRGDLLLHLDNIREFVDSAAFASILTAAVYQGRLLGSSKMIDVANYLIAVGTGNNIRATGEIVKRTVPILLQPATDAPELRTDFVHPNIFAHVLKNRRLILSCLIGIVELWKNAGKPKGKEAMGGFDQWAADIGGMMVNVGYTKFLTNAVEWRRESDPRGADLRVLVDEWASLYHSQPVDANTLLSIATRLDLFPDVRSNKADKALQTAFGMRVLSRNIDTPVNGWVIRRSALTRPATYFLEKGGQP